jgi:hypothetical protein
MYGQNLTQIEAIGYNQVYNVKPYCEGYLQTTPSILFLLLPLTFCVMFNRSSYSKYLFKYIIL